MRRTIKSERQWYVGVRRMLRTWAKMLTDFGPRSAELRLADRKSNRAIRAWADRIDWPPLEEHPE